jgi:hypothetical protein
MRNLKQEKETFKSYANFIQIKNYIMIELIYIKKSFSLKYNKKLKNKNRSLRTILRKSTKKLYNNINKI